MSRKIFFITYLDNFVRNIDDEAYGNNSIKLKKKKFITLSL